MTPRRVLLSLCLLLSLPAVGSAAPGGGELRFCLRAEPKTFHPLLVSDQASETVRYLTAGVLIRVDRKTQRLDPELATSWKVFAGGRGIEFKLRSGVSFSDGTPFSAEDVVYTLRTMMDPALHSPVGDTFETGGAMQASAPAKDRVSVTFVSPVAGLDALFDQVAILSSRSPKKEAAVLGPFRVASYKAGAEVLLERNPYYWKKDATGRRLPYLDAIRLEVQQNREIELLRFRRGQLHLIDSVDPEAFDRLAAESKSRAYDAGPSLDAEFLWFNLAPGAPLPDFKKAWFGSRRFRRAVSSAIQRADLCRVVYRGHAQSAAGPVSPANLFWFNQRLKPHAFDPVGALRELEQEGFHRRDGVLRDRAGHNVEFSLITNAGNTARERMAAMIQQDLTALGIRLNVVSLDFRSLIERMTRTFQYEACLLGFSNVDLDPNAQLNVWMSSGANHPWNPGQKSPATAWEAEIDKLMRAQAAALDRKQRKVSFDRVQQIVWDEAPVIYLVHRNSLTAISPAVRNAAPSVLPPQAFWNADVLSLADAGGRR